MLIEQLAEHGIRLRNNSAGTQKIICPKCSLNRKNKTEPCLSVTVEDDGVVWFCHNCAWADGVHERHDRTSMTRAPRPQPPKIEHKPGYPPTVLAFFAKRKIPADVLERNKIGFEQVWMPGCEPGEKAGAITYPYHEGDAVVNVKFRTHDKQFRQIKNGKKIYYGINDLAGQDAAIIVEGENDKLAFEVAGFLNVVSVPDGAPQKLKDDASAFSKKFEFVDNCADAFKDIKKIIIAVDNDPPGEVLAEELARRYGKHRCWRVIWPSLGDVVSKDANEVLVDHGPQTLREMIEYARPYPMPQFSKSRDFEEDIWARYEGRVKRGLHTGWACFDALYRPTIGQMLVATGVMSHGKSQFLDCLNIQMAERHGWKFGMCSFENQRDDHFAKLAEIRARAPFDDGPTPRMTRDDVKAVMPWVDDHFTWIQCPDEDGPTIDWILEQAAVAVMREGINALLIDPYNYLDNTRPKGVSETEHICKMLKKVSRFAKAYNLFIEFVAHPQKPQRNKNGEYPVLSLYDISGSAHWGNIADVGMVVVRDKESNRVEIHVNKVRSRSGVPGVATFEFDRVTGRYSPFVEHRRSYGND